MNLRLILGKDALETELTGLKNILNAYIFMFASKDELRAQLQNKEMRDEYDSLKRTLSFPELEEKQIASYNDKWTVWINQNYSEERQNWEMFKSYIDDCTLKLIFMKRALKRCTQTKDYEDLLKFLQKQQPDDLQKALIREEHRLTDPAEMLLTYITKLKEFTQYLGLENAETFRKSEMSAYETLLPLLTELKADIHAFNTQDGKVNQKEFLDWRNPSNN